MGPLPARPGAATQFPGVTLMRPLEPARDLWINWVDCREGCFLVDKLCSPKKDAPAGKGAGPLDLGRAAPCCKGAKLGAL